MNNTLNSNRLSMLIQRQWIEFGKIYLMSLAVLAGIFIAFYGYSIYEVYRQNADNHALQSMLSFRPYLFVFMGLLFITIISGTYFSNLGQKPKAIFELLLPASKLEKFFVAIFYTTILTTVSYLLIFFLVDLGFVSYIRSNFSSSYSYFDEESGREVVVDQLMFFYKQEINPKVYLMTFLPYLLSALFLLGSIMFTKFQYIKSAVLLTVYILLYILFMLKVIQFFTQDTIRISEGVFSEEVNILRVICVLGVLVTVAVWGIGYLRLKEKEV